LPSGKRTLVSDFVVSHNLTGLMSVMVSPMLAWASVVSINSAVGSVKLTQTPKSVMLVLREVDSSFCFLNYAQNFRKIKKRSD